MSCNCQMLKVYTKHIRIAKMNTLITILSFVLTHLVVCRSSSDILYRRIKRTDIDLSTCIDNFDIHRDKIIRTQDSQKMGAKYLNAIDLGSREECLRLCCETENCDVFVFEDKSSGSCYLFHCGPPEDFKCKFTHHVNYSSAVLAINRHIPDLESQIKLTKHEQDLTKLRKSDIDSDSASNVPDDAIPQPIISSTTVRTKEVLPNQKNKIEEKKCSRYQFECRSTRECIAIYNACDGIPQCTDGSDEASELGCPEPSTPPPPIPQRAMASNPAAAQNYDKNVGRIKNQDPSSQIDVYHPPPVRSATLPENQLVPAVNPDFLRPIPQDQRIPAQAPPYPEPPEYNPQMPQMGWNTHPSGPVSYQLPPAYPGKTSHIFNHKENGLQVPEAEIRYNRNKGAMNFLHRTSGIQNEINEGPYSDGSYPKVQNYYGDNYRQAMEIPNWVNAHQDDLRYPSRLSQDPSYNTNNREAPPQDKYAHQTKTAGWSDERENPEHIQIKMAHELKNSKESHREDVHKEDTKIKIIEKPAEPKHDEYPDVVAYKMDGNDGVAQTPGGAVLSLTLGLVITCIMAVMIGCRLRILKRRIRKGAKGYAHDADYLVNGMYL